MNKIEQKRAELDWMPFGIEKLEAYVDFGRLCKSHNQEVDALNAFGYVLNNISWSSMGNEKKILDWAVEGLESLSDSGNEYVWEVASQKVLAYWQWRNKFDDELCRQTITRIYNKEQVDGEKLKEVASYISQDKGSVMIFYNPEEDAHYIDDLNAIPYVDVQFMIDCTDKECCKIASTKMDCDVIVITENVDRHSILNEISSAPYYNGIPIIKIGGYLEDYDECNRLIYTALNFPFVTNVMEYYCKVSAISRRLMIPFDVSRYKILVTDDCTSNVKILTRLLPRYGYDVISAEDNVGTLELLKTNTCSLVITDVNRPNGDGIYLLKQIKSLDAYKDVPVIALTAQCFESDILKIANGGFYNISIKPLSADVLNIIIKQMLMLYEYMGIRQQIMHGLKSELTQ